MKKDNECAHTPVVVNYAQTNQKSIFCLQCNKPLAMVFSQYVELQKNISDETENPVGKNIIDFEQQRRLIKGYPEYEKLFEQLIDTAYKNGKGIPLVSVLGILDLVKDSIKAGVEHE